MKADRFIAVAMLACFSLVNAFSPPVSKDTLLQYQRRWRNQGPQPLLDSGYKQEIENAPPALRVMNGKPGSFMDTLRQDQSMDKWYVAPPGGFQGLAADSVDIQRVPVGPPGSDAAAMSRTLSYGPPGTANIYVAGPPAHVPRQNQS